MENTEARTRTIYRDVTWLARRWGLNRYTIYRMAKRGELNLVRVGLKWKVHLNEVSRIERMRSAS